jgi:hypothetical protein
MITVFHFLQELYTTTSWRVGLKTGKLIHYTDLCYGLDVPDSIPDVGNDEISYLHDRVQTGSEAHLAPLSNGYRGLLICGYSGWGVKLTTHLHLVLRSKTRGD